jgi:hypothetical protein
MLKDRYALIFQSAYCFVYIQNFVFDSEFYYCCWHRILVILSFISPHVSIEEKQYFLYSLVLGSDYLRGNAASNGFIDLFLEDRRMNKERHWNDTR